MQTRIGGLKAAETNKARYGEQFYKMIGSKGGKTYCPNGKGFALMTREKRIEAGRKGGSVSKRRPKDVRVSA